MYENCSECQNKTKTTISVHNMFCTAESAGILSLQFSRTMNNLSSYCGLVDAKIRAFDKDLPVLMYFSPFSYEIDFANDASF